MLFSTSAQPGGVPCRAAIRSDHPMYCSSDCAFMPRLLRGAKQNQGMSILTARALRNKRPRINAICCTLPLMPTALVLGNKFASLEPALPPGHKEPAVG